MGIRNQDDVCKFGGRIFARLCMYFTGRKSVQPSVLRVLITVMICPGNVYLGCGERTRGILKIYELDQVSSAHRPPRKTKASVRCSQSPSSDSPPSQGATIAPPSRVGFD